MFAGSSRGIAKRNPDGSVNIFCYNCHRFIARGFTGVSRALCVICQSAEEGKPLTPEFLQAYEASKMEQSDVNYLNLTEPENPQPALRKKFRFGSIAGPILTALGRFGLANQTQPEEKQKLPSAILAKEKRRGRLFSNGELTDGKK